MQRLFGNFHISRNQIAFDLVEQVTGNYLIHTQPELKVTKPSNVSDVKKLLKEIDKQLSLFNNKHLSINVIIDDSQFEELNVSLLKTTLENEDIDMLDHAQVAIEQLIDKQIEQFIKLNNVQLVGTKVTYEYLLYKSNGQIKVYHVFPRGKKFTKIIAKTSFCYQKYSSKYNQILSLFGALKADQINLMLTSQVNSAMLKNEQGVHLSIENNHECTLLKLIYNGAIISYKKLLVGTDNLIHKIALEQNISIKNTLNKVKYIINQNDNTQIWTDQNLSEAHVYLKMYADFLEQEMKKFVSQKYISPEKLNTLSFSGESDWMNNYFEKKYFLPSNLGFVTLWKQQNTSLSNKLQKTQEPITISVMEFLKDFILKEHNTVNTISSHYDFKHTKKQRFLLFRELFANWKLI
ncbi:MULTISPECIES: MAG3720 family protein [unclassified Mycoplasma]|uniref:MAG3720 family protein n=1 Tax=unclassified Mycoplasma TaxID=2683645 RepID=UPI00211B98E9|nr:MULTISPECIES: hypothetical protein [unclassified Mycoplasma]UUM20123.1 hypothetical protein NPA11_01720 [Mycoplasma sp. 1578d]UUM25103.1 hypothetical protein NPA12_01695 [Mycoplasma sp. 3686d]